MITTVLALILATLFHSTISGTEQTRDRIIYNGKEFELLRNFPMENYFEKYPDKRPQGIISSNLWRGYVATFEVKNNQLYLKNIEIQTRDSVVESKMNWESIFNELFPNQEQVKVDWVTEWLVLPHGKRTKQRYGSYEHYILLEMNNGSLVTEKHFYHRQHRRFLRQR